jgi:hypothetical protein
VLSPLVLDGLKALGVGLAGVGALALASRPAHGASPAKAQDPTGNPRTTQILVAAGAAVVVGLVSGWVVAGAWAGLGGWAAVSWVRGDRARARSVALLDARASWAGLVRGLLLSGKSLDVALERACDRAPAILQADMAILRGQMRARPTAEAVQAWAARSAADDAEARQTACVLMLASSSQAGGVADLMGMLTAQLRAKAATARRIERDRRRYRTAARVIIGLTVAWVLAGSRLDAQLFAVYGGLRGQVLLAVVLGVLALGIRAMARSDQALA